MKAFLVAIIALFIIGTYANLSYHEDTHEQVLIHYGYKNVTGGFAWDGWDFYAYRTGVPVNTTNTEAATDMNLLSEVIGYHQTGLIYNLWFMWRSMRVDDVRLGFDDHGFCPRGPETCRLCVYRFGSTGFR